LMRPPNSLMIGLGVLVGYLAAGRTLAIPAAREPILGFLTGFFISSFSMTLNDIKDVEVDRVNQPNRPIVRGMVSPTAASMWAGALLLLGLLASIPTGLYTFIYSLLFAALGWLYSDELKRHGLAGNMVVAASVAAPFPYGALLVDAITDPYILFITLTAFLSALGREVIKGIPDVKGDREIGHRTLAVTHGERSAASVASIFFVSASLLSLMPALLGLAGQLYLPTVLPPAFLHLYLAHRIVRRTEASEALRVKRVAIPAMALGLLAFTLGGVGRP
jgi:geranylgeranylglycerol-phosphate geranylgeranyltransferase